MTDSIKPPGFATLLLSIFASEPDFPEIAGDLSEEFHYRLLTSNQQTARRLYWRDTFRNLWALTKRPSTIQVFAVAALCVCISVFSPRLFINQLNRFYSGIPDFVFMMLLLYLFNTTIALLSGGLMSYFIRGRELMLRLAFAAFYLLYVVSISGYAFAIRYFVMDKYFTLNIANWFLTIIAFWIGSLWMGKRRLRQRAA
jgi:hypothetical protein